MTASLLHKLLSNEEHAIEAIPDGVFRRVDSGAGTGTRRGILAGSFNPLHTGHENLRRAADRFVQLETIFELSVSNVDKPSLSEHEIGARLCQFDTPVLLTNAPVFTRKAELFPGSTFVVGYDTAERILDPKYYDGSTGLYRALAGIRDLDCRFLVAARLTRGRLCANSDLPTPAGFADMFEAIPESKFREDISSTAIRGGAVDC